MAELQSSVSDRRPIRGLLLDLDGVVHVRGTALPGSEAIARVRDQNIPLKFVTNTTRLPRRRIVEDLAQMGLRVAMEDVFTPAISARAFLLRENLALFLVAHPDLREDFVGLPEQGREAVVLGDAGACFTYDILNNAFRKILRGAAFLALANNRNFLDRDGELSLDLGAFVSAVEYASSRKALVLGKPSRLFFALAVDSLGCAAQDVAMIGDDVEADVGGAMAAGLMGVLVQTGKYRSGQEKQLDPPPTFVARNLTDAIDFLLS
ncbi:TIGR01458 family HAD-type hydrolase [Rhodoblastus sp.]|uniref:TIGR01458 family HAD-type hydrolase n=1 Tax=Rhodoblastus sp. TaxID=1962975 RepID=UPI003F9D4385